MVGEVNQVSLLSNENELENVLIDIKNELGRAEKKFPGWPSDPVHGAAIVAEESGELIKAAIDWYYGRGKARDVKAEAIQTAAMAVRFLIFMNRTFEEIE